MSEHIIDTNDEDFEKDILDPYRIVLVDFWATWCQPCKGLSHILQDVTGNFVDMVKVVKAEVDMCPGTVKRLGIRGVPTLQVYRDGVLMTTNGGVITKEQLVSLIKYWHYSTMPTESDSE